MGVAFLDGRDARIIREPGLAAASPWIGCIAQHGTPCDTVIAHIRRATQGMISLANTQPLHARCGAACMSMRTMAWSGTIGRSTSLEYEK
jgi:predicted glutamine amidotransferase